MAKKKLGRPSTNRDDVTVKLDRALATKVKLLATHLDKPVGEVLANLLSSSLDRAYSTMLRELEAKHAERKSK